MKLSSCVRAAALSAVLSLWASSAMAQVANPGQPSEAQQDEIYCVSDKLMAAGDAAYDVVDSFLYDDSSKEQRDRATKAFTAAIGACATEYKWSTGQKMLSEKINLYSLVADYLSEELLSEGLKEEQLDLIYSALGRLPNEDLNRFLVDSWLEDAEFAKRLNGALIAAKFPGDDEYFLETARLIMESTVRATAGMMEWVRTSTDKQ